MGASLIELTQRAVAARRLPCRLVPHVCAAKLLVNRIELGGGFTATRAAAGSMRREESSRRGLLAALGRDRLELLLGRLVLTPAIRAHRLVVGIVCSELVGCRARGRRPPFERRARRL